jgi:hypothetical protein
MRTSEIASARLAVRRREERGDVAISWRTDIVYGSAAPRSALRDATT